MKKFSQIYSEKVELAEKLKEEKIISDFSHVYSALLESYNIISTDNIPSDLQVAFSTDLHKFWSESDGLTESGKLFLGDKKLSLNENSTDNQKINFLKTKAGSIINETLRQSQLKWKIYDVLDEAYKQVNGRTISDVLEPEAIIAVIKESFDQFINEINKEISDSDK